ncbi:uncharacterized protein J3R85_009762 [Psidium guajava]|nr:uncharacterized protein J3R85_009762 [Psidium guajava]
MVDEEDDRLFAYEAQSEDKPPLTPILAQLDLEARAAIKGVGRQLREKLLVERLWQPESCKQYAMNFHEVFKGLNLGHCSELQFRPCTLAFALLRPKVIIHCFSLAFSEPSKNLPFLAQQPPRFD